MARKSVPLAWAGVTLVGIIVIVLVVSWQLFPRLGAAQSMVDDLSPAFTVDRVKETAVASKSSPPQRMPSTR